MSQDGFNNHSNDACPSQFRPNSRCISPAGRPSVTKSDSSSVLWRIGYFSLTLNRGKCWSRQSIAMCLPGTPLLPLLKASDSLEMQRQSSFSLSLVSPHSTNHVTNAITSVGEARTALLLLVVSRHRLILSQGQSTRSRNQLEPAIEVIPYPMKMDPIQCNHAH